MHYSSLKSTIIFFVLTLLVCGCNKRKQAEGLTYSIDLDKQIEKGIPFSQIFEEVQFIPLETNRKCMIQRIRKLEMYDDKIFVLDERQSALFCLYIF